MSSGNSHYVWNDSVGFFQQPLIWNCLIAIDILIAIDRIRQWRIDPTKHFQSEVHNLIVLIERANETNARQKYFSNIR